MMQITLQEIRDLSHKLNIPFDYLSAVIEDVNGFNEPKVVKDFNYESEVRDKEKWKPRKDNFRVVVKRSGEVRHVFQSRMNE